MVFHMSEDKIKTNFYYFCKHTKENNNNINKHINKL